VLRWTSLIGSVWSIVTGAVVLTIAMMIEIVVLIVIVWHHGLDARNFAVLALFGVMLLPYSARDSRLLSSETSVSPDERNEPLRPFHVLGVIGP